MAYYTVVIVTVSNLNKKICANYMDMDLTACFFGFAKIIIILFYYYCCCIICYHVMVK